MTECTGIGVSLFARPSWIGECQWDNIQICTDFTEVVMIVP